MWSLRAGALLSPDAIRSALAAGAEVNKEAPDNRRTALHYAAAVGDADVAILLLDAGAAIATFDASNRSPLALACRGGHAAVVSLLVARAPPKHLPILLTIADDEAGARPLHDAVAGGALAAVAALLDAGADPAAADRAGCTALVRAAERGDAPAVGALLAAAAAGAAALLGQADARGRTALLAAAQEGHADCVAALLGAMDAAEIDGADADGLSALGWAATLGHAPVCEALLAAGADRAALGDELEGELDALLAEAEAERKAEAEAEAAAAAPPIDYSSQGRLLLGEIAKYELPPPKEAPAAPAALLLIAKWPAPGRSKTRLAASLARGGMDDAVAAEAAAAFARASLSDLLVSFGHAVATKVLVYAPPDAPTRANFAALLGELGVAGLWALQPALASTPGASADLGALLADAAATCRERTASVASPSSGWTARSCRAPRSKPRWVIVPSRPSPTCARRPTAGTRFSRCPPTRRPPPPSTACGGPLRTPASRSSPHSRAPASAASSGRRTPTSTTPPTCARCGGGWATRLRTRVGAPPPCSTSWRRRARSTRRRRRCCA